LQDLCNVHMTAYVSSGSGSGLPTISHIGLVI